MFLNKRFFVAVIYLKQPTCVLKMELLDLLRAYLHLELPPPREEVMW